ncbi:MAG: ribonuclease III [Chloroflexota bacterium]
MDFSENLLDLEAFQDHIELRFNQTDLLQQALTHRSYINEHVEKDLEDNERLEFLGDAILDYITADMLFRRFPGMAEGEMTRLRAALVRTESLAQLATDCRVGDAMLIGKGEARSGGRYRDNNLCRTFEALVGAIYLDKGLEAVRDFVIPRLTELQKDVMDEAIRKDPRSQFQEWSQAHYSITPTYAVLSTSGPEHNKVFEVGVFLVDVAVARGDGRSKRAAAQSAARQALLRVEQGEDLLPDSSA